MKKAIVLNKNDISVRKILAGVYSRQGRLDDAIGQYKDVVELKPDDSVALVELAKCYIKKNEFDNAIKISKEYNQNQSEGSAGLCQPRFFSGGKRIVESGDTKLSRGGAD